MVALIVVAVVVVFVLVVAARTIRVIPQARAGVVERLGRYSRTLEPGLTIVTPFIDRVKPLVDLREQVVNFSPQSVITEDNVVVGIETVLYFTITDPRSATYEIANPLQAIEQLTVTTLRNVIGGLTLEATLTARENVNTELRVVLDEATGKWGITDQPRRDQVGRPAAGHQDGDGEADARRARPPRRDPHRRRREAGPDPHRRGSASSRQRCYAPRATARRRSCAPRAKRRRSTRSSKRSTRANPTASCSATNTCRCCPQLAEGDSNKVFVMPSEFAEAFGGIGEAMARRRGPPRPRRRYRRSEADVSSLRSAREAACRRSPAQMSRVAARHADRGRTSTRAMREIRLALLEADVNFKVVRQFTAAAEGALPGRRYRRPAQPRPAGREDRRRGADRI